MAGNRAGVYGVVFALAASAAWGQTYTDVTPDASGVSASTSDINVPANAVDDNVGTRWSANGDGQWLELDLGSGRTVGHVKAALYSGNTRQSFFDVQVSNDRAVWATVWSGASGGTTTGLETFDFSDVDARWVRYLGHGNSSPLAGTRTWNSVSEIQVFALSATPTPTPTRTPTPTPRPTATPTPTPTPTATPTGATYSDVTPGASGVIASTNDGNIPGNAVDSSLSTRWSANGDGQWLELDLGSARTVGYVRVALYGGDTRRSLFDLQVSTGGGTWTTVWSGSSSGTTTALETFEFPDADARWVRYRGHGNSTNTWNSVSEMRVFALGGATPTPPPTPTPTLAPGAFQHPGVLNSRASLDFVKGRIAAGAQPWKAAFDELGAHPLASLSRTHQARSVVECGSGSMPDNGCTDETADAAAAYANALLWYYTGDTARASKAIYYMNAWSAVITDHTGSNAPLQTAWAALNWTKAAEIVRHTGAGWSSTDVSRFRTMLLDVYYPKTRNGSNANGNWELSMIDGNIGIGVFTDTRSIFDAAVTMWRGRTPAYIYLATDGALPLAPPGRSRPSWYNPGFYVDGLSQETCRDLEHASYGLANIVYTAETAYIQGVDLYAEQSRRIRAGYEYNTRLQNGWSGDGICGGNVHRNLKEIGEVTYNHYAVRLGHSMPFTSSYVQSVRPANPTWFAVVWETVTHAQIGAP